jgi:hypothetical protein
LQEHHLMMMMGQVAVVVAVGHPLHRLEEVVAAVVVVPRSHALLLVAEGALEVLEEGVAAELPAVVVVAAVVVLEHEHLATSVHGRQHCPARWDSACMHAKR